MIATADEIVEVVKQYQEHGKYFIFVNGAERGGHFTYRFYRFDGKWDEVIEKIKKRTAMHMAKEKHELEQH